MEEKELVQVEETTEEISEEVNQEEVLDLGVEYPEDEIKEEE